MERVEALKKKLTLQKYDKEAKTGCLTNEMTEYLKCFVIKKDRLEFLLQMDMNNWSQNEKKLGQRMDELKQQI